MKGWELKTLDKVCFIKGGKRLPKGHELTNERTSHPYIRARDIGNGKVNFDSPTYLKEDTFRLIKNYIVKEGDTIITIVGANIGDVAYITKEFDNANLTENALKLVSKRDVIEPKFLNYVLLPDKMKEYFQVVSSGAAQGKLGIYKVKNIKILLPPLPTQRRIASILSAYDDLIENNLKRIKLLEEIAQRTYEEWFVKFRVNGEQLPIDEKTGLPVGWSIIEFQDVGQIVTGKTPSTTNELFFDGEIPFVKTPDMSGFPYVLTTSQYLSELGANTQKNKYIPKNSLMVSCIGSAGVIALASQSCQTNQQINTIVFKESIYTFYFYCFAKGLKPVLEALGSNGATMTNVNKGKFEKIKIVCPNRETLEEFHSLSNPIFELVLGLQKQNQKLKESRDILLPKLMNGTINVEKE